MASGLMTGLNASSYARYIRGPGKLYKDFTSYPTSPGTLLGATKGGSEFSWGMEYFDLEPDGAQGLITNHRLAAMCKPTLKINLIETTANNLIYSGGGFNSADQTPTQVLGEYLGTGAEVTVGVVLGQGTTGGAVDESTLSVWYTDSGLGAPTKGVLDTDYAVVDQITLASTIASDVVIIAGVTFTGAAAEDLTSREWDASGNDTAAATSLAACVNSATYGVSGVTATSALGVVSLSRATAGTPNTITTPDTTLTMEYQVIIEVVAGSIVDADLVTASYTYDATSSGDAYTVITPGQPASTDYWDNIALVCELSNQSYSNPYVAFIVKNVLSNPDTITIPGTRASETVIATTFEGFFDPSDGLTMANAPVEVQIGIS